MMWCERDVGSNNVHQRHMSEIADAPPWDSCDVTQFSHHLRCIKVQFVCYVFVTDKVQTNFDVAAYLSTVFWRLKHKMLLLMQNKLFDLFPFSDVVDEWSHSNHADTEKHVVFSHSHKLLSV